MNLDENVPKKDAYIQIVDSNRANDFDIVPNFEKQISETCKISYPSKKTNRDENIVVTTPYWEIIWLQPQSEIQLEFSGDSLINLLKLNWEVWLLSWVFNSSVDFSGGIILSPEQQEWIGWVQYNYKEFQKYFDWLSDGDDWLDKYSMKWQFSIRSLWGNIKNNIKFGRWNVYDLFKSH